MQYIIGMNNSLKIPRIKFQFFPVEHYKLHRKTLTSKVRYICTWFLTLTSFEVLPFLENLTFVFSQTAKFRYIFYSHFDVNVASLLNAKNIYRISKVPIWFPNLPIQKLVLIHLRIRQNTFVVFPRKWSTSNDVNVKNQVRM